MSTSDWLAHDRQLSRLILAALAIVATTTSAGALYIGRVTLDRLAVIETGLEAARLPVPGEEPHVRATRALTLAADQRQCEAALWLCRAVSSACAVAAAASLCAVVLLRRRRIPAAAAPDKSGVLRAVPIAPHGPCPGRPSAEVYYTPATCVARPA